MFNGTKALMAATLLASAGLWLPGQAQAEDLLSDLTIERLEAIIGSGQQQMVLPPDWQGDLFEYAAKDGREYLVGYGKGGVVFVFRQLDAPTVIKTSTVKNCDNSGLQLPPQDSAIGANNRFRRYCRVDRLTGGYDLIKEVRHGGSVTSVLVNPTYLGTCALHRVSMDRDLTPNQSAAVGCP